MSINNIKDYLKRFKNIEPSDRRVKNAFLESFEELFDDTIDVNNIKISNKTIFITTHPVIKKEIFLKKNTLLEKINTKLEQQRITDIR